MKPIVHVFIGLILLVGCTPVQEKECEVDSLKEQILALQAESYAKDSTINEFFRVLNEIEANLIVIKQKEQIITKQTLTSNELRADAKARINQDINLINELMSKNRQSIRYLNDQVKSSNFRIEEFEKRLIMASEILSSRDEEIDALRDRLSKLDFSIGVLYATLDTLSKEKHELIAEVNRQTQTLNTAWYAYGTKNELMENHIVERTGGFLGFGRTLKIKPDFNPSYFTRIDITSNTIIPLYTKKVNLLSTHPSGSYLLNLNAHGIIERLEIVDYEAFWSSTRYLVIEVY